MEGRDDTLVVTGRLVVEITTAIEARIGELPEYVTNQFNYFSTPDETVDWSSRPIIYMPDEFNFALDDDRQPGLRSFRISTDVCHLPFMGRDRRRTHWQPRLRPAPSLD
jgi:hypothetical protein